MGRLQDHQKPAVNPLYRPRVRDKETMYCTSREMHMIEFLAALDSVMQRSGDDLEARMRMIKNGWRDYKLVRATLRRLLTEVYDTLPLKSLRHMENICENGEMLVRLKYAARQPGQYLVNEDTLLCLIDCAFQAECSLCVRTGDEIGRCRIFRDLMELMPPDELPKYSCPYAHAHIED